MSGYKLIFMGTPAFSVAPLKALLKAGHDIKAVYSQPPRPAGRGEKIRMSPVHAAAEDLKIPVHTPKSLKSEETLQQFKSHCADFAVVVAYGLILPQAILAVPLKGCLNIHASLLPRWRGAAPIQRAIQAGDEETGITLMQMDVGLDTGDILLKRALPLLPSTTGQSLHDDLSELGAALIVDYLNQRQKGIAHSPCHQPSEGVTYAQKLSRDESLIDWRLPAEQIERTLRAFTPWPGLYFFYQSARIKIVQAQAVSDAQGEAGTTLDDQLTIACGKGALRITKLQKEGKTPMETSVFLNGTSVPKGVKLL